MPLSLDTSIANRMKIWSAYFNIALILIPVLVLAGWQLDIYFLKTFLLPPLSMNPLTAICFIALGGATWLLEKDRNSWAAHLLLTFTVIITLLKIACLVFDLPFSPDTFLFAGKLITQPSFPPNRVAPVTAICFILASLALFIRGRGRSGNRISQYLVLAIAFTSLLSILGYLYQVQAFSGFLIHISMAASTALCFFLLSVIVLFSEPAQGVMKDFTSTFSGSFVARLMIPAAFIIPSVLGLLSLQGNWAGLYANEFGMALYVMSVILIFVCITWYNAHLLNKRDLLKKETEDALRSSEKHIQAILQNAPDAVVVIDNVGLVTKWNHEAENLFGWTAAEAHSQHLSDLIIPEDLREMHIAGLKRYLETGKTTILGRTIDIRALRKDGTQFDVSLRISPLELDDKKFFIGFLRDITERRNMEERLMRFNEGLSQQVEEKTGELKEIFDRITDGFIALDNEFRYTYLNKKAADMVQRDATTLIGKSVWEEFPMAVGSETYKAFHKALNEQQFVFNTDYFAPLDIWQSNFIYPSPNGLSIFIRDISAEKKAATEISKAKSIADKLIDSLPGVFYFFDSNGKFIRWNREFEKVTGYSKEEIAVMQPTDFFGDEFKSYIRGRIETVFHEGINDAEASFLSKEGKRVPYYFKAVLINYDGKPCLLGTGIDIAERKKAEEELLASERKYKLLFESNPLPMWMLNLPDYTIADVNNAAMQQYGYPREEFLKLNVTDFRPPEDVPRFKATTDTSFRGIHHAGIWRHMRKDRSLIYVDIVTYDLIYKDRQTRLVLANDVTEKHIAQERLEESFNAIRKLTGHLQEVREEERLHMAREIHDELGQLLTVLKMDVSWLSKKIAPVDAPVKSKLDEIMEGINTTSKTIRRIASELRPSLLDDLGLLAAMEWHLEEFERRSGILKELHIPDTEIPLPDTFKIGIFRIFQESLTNVARHSGADNVFVSLTPQDNKLVLTIRDNGKGLSERQGNKKTLGLLGMKERSQMMGGQYQIRSKAGEGTTVTVIVPLPETDL
jgi:PAS domain S-box-containing protein